MFDQILETCQKAAKHLYPDRSEDIAKTTAYHLSRKSPAVQKKAANSLSYVKQTMKNRKRGKDRALMRIKRGMGRVKNVDSIEVSRDPGIRSNPERLMIRVELWKLVRSIFTEDEISVMLGEETAASHFGSDLSKKQFEYKLMKKKKAAQKVLRLAGYSMGAGKKRKVGIK